MVTDETNYQINLNYKLNSLIMYVTSLTIYISGQSVRQWPGRPGFSPRSSHTKDSKNGT